MIHVEQFEDGRYLAGTLEIIRTLVGEPATRLACAHGDDNPVMGLYEVPKGCVALPGLEVQPLCAHHAMSDGSFEGMTLIVDLSLDCSWSQLRKEKPDLFIGHSNSGNLELKELELFVK